MKDINLLPDFKLHGAKPLLIAVAALIALLGNACSKQTQYRDIDADADEGEVETASDYMDETELDADDEIKAGDELDEADELYDEEGDAADLYDDEPDFFEREDENSADEAVEPDESADDDGGLEEPENVEPTGDETDYLQDADEVEIDLPRDEESEDEPPEDDDLCPDCGASCSSGADCRDLLFVCVEGKCAHCESDEQCIDETSGGYAARTKCENGICIADWCAQNLDCPEEKPVCREGRCDGCSADAECSFGKCLFTQGLCYYGDCYVAGGVCGSYGEKICDDNLVCRRCKDDAECYKCVSNEKAICENGSCAIGCSDAGNCNSGWICDLTHRCVPCLQSDECAAQYGASYKCLDGYCVQ